MSSMERPTPPPPRPIEKNEPIPPPLPPRRSENTPEDKPAPPLPPRPSDPSPREQLPPYSFKPPSYNDPLHLDAAEKSLVDLTPLPSLAPSHVEISTPSLPDYIYSPINTSDAEIRVLTLHFDVKQVLGRVNVGIISGSMKTCFLPVPSLSTGQKLLRCARLPVYEALSYAWGNPTRSHEIIVDGKRLGITQNLYKALRDIQKDAIGPVYLWADAICINQDDLVERSAQIILMRQVYHSATLVKIWLGPATEDGRKCLQFILNFTGRYTVRSTTYDTPDDKLEESVVKSLLIPGGVFVRAGYGLGNAFEQVGDIFGTPVTQDDGKDVLLDRVDNLSLHEETIDSLIKWKPADRYWKTVQDEDFILMARLIDQTFLQDCDWFGRMWVVQEMSAATLCDILYDGRTVTFTNFLRCICYLHYNLDAHVSHIRKLIGMEKIRMGWNRGKRQSLRDLIYECRHRHATDPRDKIFSLLGIMGDRMSDLLKPDYTKSVSEVYAHATFHFIKQSESLDPICGWQSLGRQDQLPSWVPDYALSQELAAAPLITQDGCEYHAAKPNHRSIYDFKPDQIESWSRLPTTGLCIDSIDRVSDSMPEDESFGNIEKMWVSTVVAAGSILQGLTEQVAQYLEEISSVVTKLSNYWNSVDHSSQFTRSTDILSKFSVHSWFSTESLPKLKMESVASFSPPTSNPFLHEAYILDAYFQTLLCGRISTRQRLTTDKMDSIMSPGFMADLSSTQRREDVLEACKALESGMTKRKIGITDNGYIGAMPQDAQPGDIICVLFGCSVPVVLRKRVGEEYLFIGDCYLHGFMDAEAIAMQIKGELREERFVLC